MVTTVQLISDQFQTYVWQFKVHLNPTSCFFNLQKTNKNALFDHIWPIISSKIQFFPSSMVFINSNYQSYTINKAFSPKTFNIKSDCGPDVAKNSIFISFLKIWESAFEGWNRAHVEKNLFKTGLIWIVL